MEKEILAIVRLECIVKPVLGRQSMVHRQVSWDDWVNLMYKNGL